MDVGRLKLLGWFRLRVYHISNIRDGLGENKNQASGGRLVLPRYHLPHHDQSCPEDCLEQVELISS